MNTLYPLSVFVIKTVLYMVLGRESCAALETAVDYWLY